MVDTYKHGMDAYKGRRVYGINRITAICAGFYGALSRLANLKLTEEAIMASIFLLGEVERAAFLQHMMQSFGCTYICLWSYLPLPSKWLLILDGIYQEAVSQQPSSSAGSLARRLFNAYCETVNYADRGQVPGYAFENNLPYIEMDLADLQRLASSQVQMQFYQEAGIKIVVFMGCTAGEIELGMSSAFQVDIRMEMEKWFPGDFNAQTAAGELRQPTTINQNRPSTSQRSFPVDSMGYLASLFDIPSSSNFMTERPMETSPFQEATDALRELGSIQFPTVASEDAAMTKATLNVRTSPSPSPASQQTAQNLPTPRQEPTTAPRRNLNARRREEPQMQENRQPTAAQLHHAQSERKRREKLNESIDALRSHLPPGSKKDKASVLSSTIEYLSSLKSQVEELTGRNQMLETQLLNTNQREAGTDQELGFFSSTDQRVHVEIAQVSASTSGGRFLELRVNLRSGKCSVLHLVSRVLGFLRRQRNISLFSLQSNTRIMESTPVHGLVMRLKVEGDEFDMSGFQEAVRRVVDGLP